MLWAYGAARYTWDEALDKISLVIDGDGSEESLGQGLYPLILGLEPCLDFEPREKPAVASIAEAPRPVATIDRDKLGLLRLTATETSEGRPFSKAKLRKRPPRRVFLRHGGRYGFHLSPVRLTVGLTGAAPRFRRPVQPMVRR